MSEVYKTYTTGQNPTYIQNLLNEYEYMGAQTDWGKPNGSPATHYGGAKIISDNISMQYTANSDEAAVTHLNMTDLTQHQRHVQLLHNIVCYF